jgi:hypothetical protein
MKTLGIRGCILASLVWLAWGAIPARLQATQEDVEQHFEVLQIGTHAYTNVTVTTKSKDYLFILHSAGMTNIKVAELSPEEREQLGYPPLPKPKPHATNATDWAQQTLAKLETPQVKAVGAQVITTWRKNVPVEKLQLPRFTPQLVWGMTGAFVAIYLFFCYCCHLICQKTGQAPSVLVWLPVLNMFPLLRAAGMSPWWFLAFFVPVLNFVAYFLWCLKIARARVKTAWTAVFLFLPPTSLLAFLYLAFSSGGGPKKKENRRVRIMTLETA